MNTEFFGIIFTFLTTVALAIPFGKYIANTFAGKSSRLDKLLLPVEGTMYRIAGIDPNIEMNWKQQMKALLSINLLWLVLSVAILMNQHYLPLNPDNNPGMPADLAFNTAVSFVVNCNLQHYAGETGVSYLSQLWLMFLQFVSAATGMAAAVALFRAFRDKQVSTLGNFYQYLIKSCTRILLPLSFLLAIIFMLRGMPMTFKGKDNVINMMGDSISVSRGPVAAFVPIKHLGTNGGGFFGANSAHPLENPDYLTNMLELCAQMVIPIAMIFAFGFFIRRKKIAWMIFSVMTIGFVALVVPTVIAECQGNVAIAEMDIDMQDGAMEGKEMRFGAAASGFWSVATTVISTGSVNAMHDSMMPLSGMNQILAMMVNAFYGGCGVGLLNFFVFIILGVFISGLMVGRTPEFMGKKVEAHEIKLAMMIALLHPFLILLGTALAVAFPQQGAATLNNSSFHGFSEILYEYTSAAANNGSGFEGLGDNNCWWNISTGIVLLLGRYLPIIGPIAIAGMMAQKKTVPHSSGTLPTDNATFGLMVFAVIAIVTALSFFPALTLGPIAEFFTMK